VLWGSGCPGSRGWSPCRQCRWLQSSLRGVPAAGAGGRGQVASVGQGWAGPIRPGAPRGGEGTDLCAASRTAGAGALTRRTPDVSPMRAAVQAVNSTTSTHPANWPADLAMGAAANCSSASQSRSVSERGSASSAKCSNRNDRSRPHLTRIDLLTCVDDLHRPPCPSMMGKGGLVLRAYARTRAAGQGRHPTHTCTHGARLPFAKRGG
jgi:hypothetical protein